MFFKSFFWNCRSCQPDAKVRHGSMLRTPLFWSIGFVLDQQQQYDKTLFKWCNEYTAHLLLNLLWNDQESLRRLEFSFGLFLQNLKGLAFLVLGIASLNVPSLIEMTGKKNESFIGTVHTQAIIGRRLHTSGTDINPSQKLPTPPRKIIFSNFFLMALQHWSHEC